MGRSSCTWRARESEVSSPEWVLERFRPFSGVALLAILGCLRRGPDEAGYKNGYRGRSSTASLVTSLVRVVAQTGYKVGYTLESPRLDALNSA